jgi:hypothetical protein
VVLMGLSFAGFNSPGAVVDRIFADPEDGSWLAASFDSLGVAHKRYLVGIRRGKIVGGYDGCNGWSYQDQEPDERGERMIVSTAQACPQDRPDKLYWLLVHDPRITLLNERELRMSSAGHFGLFRRCMPDRSQTECVPVAEHGQ